MLFTFHRVPLDPTCSLTVKCKVSWISRGFMKIFDKLKFHKLHRIRWNLKQLRCLTQVSFHRSLFVSSWMINTSPGFKALNTLNRPLFTKSWNFGRPMFVSQNAVRRWWTEMTSKMATDIWNMGIVLCPIPVVLQLPVPLTEVMAWTGSCTSNSVGHKTSFYYARLRIFIITVDGR